MDIPVTFRSSSAEFVSFLSQFLSRPDLFKQIHTHTDVRLALGWASVFVAGATGLYGFKVEFEKSKPVVWAGLIVYVHTSIVVLHLSRQ